MGKASRRKQQRHEHVDHLARVKAHECLHCGKPMAAARTTVWCGTCTTAGHTTMRQRQLCTHLPGQPCPRSIHEPLPT